MKDSKQYGIFEQVEFLNEESIFSAFKDIYTTTKGTKKENEKKSTGTNSKDKTKFAPSVEKLTKDIGAFFKSKLSLSDKEINIKYDKTSGNIYFDTEKGNEFSLFKQFASSHGFKLRDEELEDQGCVMTDSSRYPGVSASFNYSYGYYIFIEIE